VHRSVANPTAGPAGDGDECIDATHRRFRFAHCAFDFVVFREIHSRESAAQVCRQGADAVAISVRKVDAGAVGHGTPGDLFANTASTGDD
jgi:hypothetical protein